MNDIKQQGYIVVGLKSINPISFDEFKTFPEETNIPNQFIARTLKSNYKPKESFSIQLTDINDENFDSKYYSRFCRLNKISNRYYHYLLSHTNDSVNQILESSREEFERVIILRSKNIIAHYCELIKIFMLNSLLHKRIVRSGKHSNLYSRFGYISKEKLGELLRGKGEAVSSYTFQAIQPITDKDFKNNLDVLRHQHLETVIF